MGEGAAAGFNIKEPRADLTPSDPFPREMIEQGYSSATSDVERAEIVMALVRLEIGRRNAFYKRVSQDGQLVKWAVEESLKRKGN